MQEKVKAGVDLVVLGEENGYRFTQEEVEDYLREVRNSYDFTQDEQQIWLERIG